MNQIYVKTKSGLLEEFNLEKIKEQVKTQSFGLSIDSNLVIEKVKEGIYNNVTTKEIDDLIIETSAYNATQHPDYSKLASRVIISRLHKTLGSQHTFSNAIKKMFNYKHPKTNEDAPIVTKEFHDFVFDHKKVLEEMIVIDRDFYIDYFGFKTLARAYLIKINNEIQETPQYLWLRVAIGIHMNSSSDLEKIKETYDLISQKKMIHATPTLFSSGCVNGQLCSCFLLTIKDDSIHGIYDTLKQCAIISKGAGGVGLAIHNVRGEGSYIKGNNGFSNGVVPMLRVFNDTARYVDQGGGKRKGSFAIFIETWHTDIFNVLDLKKNSGSENERARDLFYALWIPDLFMERVQSGMKWSLFCPNEAPGLSKVYGEEFNQLYEKYEKTEGLARRVVDAQELWKAIIVAQIETGVPYMMYKDACNFKSNQKNLGTILCGNLCTEIVQYSSEDEVAVCNLGSLNLSSFVDVDLQKFNFEELHATACVLTRNLDKIIDKTHYPIIEAKNSNLKHRPIGVGVQGLADTFAMLHLSWSSEEARKLNKDIFECIYHACVETSVFLSIENGGSYSTFHGSPASQGFLQFDLWSDNANHSGRYDWNDLKEKVKVYGMRNSLLVAPMPTASTAQILGNNESFEPFTSNIYTRRVLAGEFPIVNKHLVKDLIELNLWNDEIRNLIIKNMGSIATIETIPQEIRDIYKTVWEIKQKVLIDMAADRGQYICQSQSLNIYMASPSFSQLTSMHFYGWKKGLKTGMYYLRTRPSANPIQFTQEENTCMSCSA